MTHRRPPVLRNFRAYARPLRCAVPHRIDQAESGETIEAAEVQGWFRETYRKVHPNERSVYGVRGRTAEDLLSTTPDYSRPRRPRTLLSHSGKNREKPSHFNVMSLCAIGIFGVHKGVQPHTKVTPRVNC